MLCEIVITLFGAVIRCRNYTSGAFILPFGDVVNSVISPLYLRLRANII